MSTNDSVCPIVDTQSGVTRGRASGEGLGASVLIDSRSNLYGEFVVQHVSRKNDFVSRWCDSRNKF